MSTKPSMSRDSSETSNADRSRAPDHPDRSCRCNHASGSCGSCSSNISRRLENDSSLARIVDAWPGLPKDVRDAVEAIIRDAA